MCANGCGAAYFPKWLRKSLSVIHEVACNEHDRDYEKGGNELDRIKADYRFAEKMAKTSIKFIFISALSLLMATVFFPMVRHFGMISFNYREKK